LVRAIDGAMTGLAFLDSDLCDVEHAGRRHQADHQRVVERGRQGDRDDLGRDRMSGDLDAISAGTAAWERIRDHGRKCWDDWLAVARALAVGRTIALKTAGANRPVGSRYNAAMGNWLRSNGLDGITNQERYRALLILENLSVIQNWRGGLDGALRRRLNHPNAVWFAWRRAIKPEQPASRRQNVPSTTKPRGNGRPIYWPQNILRRAAMALHDCRSQDTFTLAHVTLEAAVRNETDLLELLASDPPVRSTAAAFVRRCG
jgi:hypothetical protein